jgi:signal transduction histidine kinase
MTLPHNFPAERWRTLATVTPSLAQADSHATLVATLTAALPRLFAFEAALLCLDNATVREVFPLFDATHAPETCTDGPLPGFASTIRLELTGGHGILQIAHSHAEMYSTDDQAVAETLAEHLGAALENISIRALLVERINALELLNEELDAYDYSAAHDLKAPLNIINNYAFLIQETSKEAGLTETANLADALADTSRAMARLLDQLLAVTRAADENDIPPATQVQPVLDKVLAQYKQPLASTGIALQTDVAVPSVRAYPVQLETIFANLVSNAIKYIGETENPRIQISAAETQDYARFEVRDNGIGMTEKEQSRLFRRFSRVGKSEAEGTGLGLAIARRTVERLGGSLGVHSAPGEGSTFWFTLPLATAE